MSRFSPLRLATLTTLVTSGFIFSAPPTWGQVYNEIFKLSAGDGAARDQFSWSISFGNGAVAVGAIGDDDNGTNSGSVYLFEASTGTPLFKLLPDDGAAGDLFGQSLAGDDGIIVVGAPEANANGTDSGSVYIFDAATGAELSKLLPNDGASFDLFGFYVAIDNGIIVVGAYLDDDNGLDSGSAYVFDALTGEQLFKLLPNDGGMNDYFGSQVAINGNIIAVAALFDDDNGTDSGSAYLFDASTGAQIAKLLPDDGRAYQWFGSSVSVDNGMVVVGKIASDYDGAAYIFDGSTGEQLSKLQPNDRTWDDLFGYNVAINNGIVAVGAPRDDDNGIDSGSAYLFDASTGTQIAKLLPSDGAYGARFGSSVALNNDSAAVGAYGDGDNGFQSGSAYVFDTTLITSCLELVVDNLVAGEAAVFTITDGTAGAKCVTVYGMAAGETLVNGYGGYCATFGINGINPSRVLGGLKRTFDGNGKITFNLNIPNNTSGLGVFFQSAQRGTCPNECVSNLVELTVR